MAIMERKKYIAMFSIYMLPQDCPGTLHYAIFMTK